MSMLSLAASSLFVSHQGQLGGEGLSPRVWGWLQGQMQAPDGCAVAKEYSDHFDFLDSDKYTVVGTFAETTTDEAGVLSTDSAEAYIGGITGQASINEATDSGRRFTAMEARVRLDTQGVSFFVGLCNPAAITTGALTTTSVADDNFCGAFLKTAGSGELGFIYRKSGGSAVYKDYQASSATTPVITAGTWHKIAWVYSPRFREGGRIRTYIDNQLCSEIVTKTELLSSSFPTDAVMTPMIGALGDGFDIDWFCFAQDRR